MVGCAMRTKMPTGRYLQGAHGAPYCDYERYATQDLWGRRDNYLTK